MANVVTPGYIPGTAYVCFDIEKQTFVANAQCTDGQWHWYYAQVHDMDDGSQAVWVGDDRTGQAWHWVTVTPAPAPTLEPGPIATLFSADVAKLQKAATFITNPKRVIGALLYREPEHGHWYQSAWMWFYLGLTALCAIIWFGPMNALTEISDGTDLGNALAWAGWFYIGWMPLAASGIGALQKAGYKRLAAAYSVMLTILITWFWESHMRDSENNR